LHAHAAAVYYTPDSLKAAGITGNTTLLLATCGVGMVKVLISMSTICLAASCIHVVVVLIVLSLFFFLLFFPLLLCPSCCRSLRGQVLSITVAVFKV
jgi:hypothetical protein